MQCFFFPFHSIEDSSFVTNTTPVFHYKKRLLTRYVLVIEGTRDMLIRESWTFLRLAVRKWAGHDLPANTEVGLVLSNDTTGHRLLPLSPLNNHVRSQISGNIPFTPGDSHSAACLHCGIRQALDVSTPSFLLGSYYYTEMCLLFECNYRASINKDMKSSLTFFLEL